MNIPKPARVHLPAIPPNLRTSTQHPAVRFKYCPVLSKTVKTKNRQPCGAVFVFAEVGALDPAHIPTEHVRYDRESDRAHDRYIVQRFHAVMSALRVGVAGPVGSGKTALVDALCKAMRHEFSIAVVTNDIYTQEDAQFLIRSQALPRDRIVGVETGGCPHTAIREDASMNLVAVEQLEREFPQLDIVFVESGGDNLAATFSPELADLTIYAIDVAAGDKIPRKGGPGITKSDLLIINKIDLAPHVGADLEVMARDAQRMRGDRPFLFTNLKTGEGVERIAAFVAARVRRSTAA